MRLVQVSKSMKALVDKPKFWENRYRIYAQGVAKMKFLKDFQRPGIRSIKATSTAKPEQPFPTRVSAPQSWQKAFKEEYDKLKKELEVDSRDRSMVRLVALSTCNGC